jgi:DNA repair protein RadD
MILRPYQQDIIGEVRQAISQGARAPLVVSPTGSGKTVMFSHIAQGAGQKNKRVWILVHRAELVEQTSRTMTEIGIHHGVIAAGWPIDPLPHVQVVSVQTVVRRTSGLIPPDVIIVDECHHAAAGTWGKILQAFPRAIRLGFTATPERLDGKGLADTFDTLIRGPEVAWLIEQGFLSQPKYYAPPNQLNLDGIQVRGGDFARDEVAKEMDKPTITGDAVSHYQRLCNGAPAVAFCASVAHAEHVAQAFSAAGYRAATLDGTLDRLERRKRVRGLADGSIQILTSCEIISEGFDIPTVTAAILLRPTKSLGMHLQQVGRVLRIAPNKPHAVILDHVGNCLRHGLAEEEREWSLEGRKKKSKKASDEDAPPVRQCPKCYACHVPAPSCPECGHTYELKKREIEQQEGELVELNMAWMAKQRRQEQAEIGTFAELVALGKSRGYKNATFWAKKIWNARQQRQTAAFQIA